VNKRLVDIDVIVDRLGAWIHAMRKERSGRTFGERFQKLYEKTVAYMKRS